MIEIKIDQETLDKAKELLKDLDPKAQEGAIKRGVNKATSYVLDILKINVSGIILRVRTGNLRNTMGMRIIKNEEGNWEGIAGSGAFSDNPDLVQSGKANKGVRMTYADILEDGGTIVPLGHPYLTIPLGKALTAAGVSRFSARELRANPEGFGYTGSVVIFPYIMGIKGKKGAKEPLFRLVDSVTIPAKRYMGITAETALEEAAEQFLEAIKERVAQ